MIKNPNINANAVRIAATLSTAFANHDTSVDFHLPLLQQYVMVALNKRLSLSLW